MKSLNGKTILLVLLILPVSFGQNKDIRALLNIEGRIKEISVSPDERLWLTTAMAGIYYADNINSLWHKGTPLYKEINADNGLYSPTLERISFFNKDTAILTGYIGFNIKKSEKNGIFLTVNGGKSWEAINYGGDSWIYDACIDKKGNAWIGGSSGDIYYSSDFGKNWRTLASPFNSISRMHSICMSSRDEGIAGALRNNICTTTDNWKTNKKISTPFDQKKYITEGAAYDNRINKLVIWDNYYVVSQEGRIYYSDKNDIVWKEFPIDIIDFAVDDDMKKLYAITQDLRAMVFISPTQFSFLGTQKLKEPSLNIKVVNNSLFIIDGLENIYKINELGFEQERIFTTDYVIAEPEVIHHAKTLTWGTTDRDIYLSDNHGKDWYRENALDFTIADFTLLNDSCAILWDGEKYNYSYSLKDHLAKPYMPDKPLEGYLGYPIIKFCISAGSQGCFHNIEDKTEYCRVNDSTFVSEKVESSGYENKKSEVLKRSADGQALANIISDINLHVPNLPSLKDFGITETDKIRYFTMIENSPRNEDYDFGRSTIRKHKDLDKSVPAMLDTLTSDSFIREVFDRGEGLTSTTSNWFSVKIINQNSDTLILYHTYYEKQSAWNLPWKIEYKGLHFVDYSIAFSRFIGQCIPDEFFDKEVFDNSLLLLRIADYIVNKKSGR